MHIDRTLLTVTVMLGVLFILLVVVNWWTRRTYPGFGRWTAAGILLVVALCLLGLRQFAPDSISVVGADGLIVIASILYFEGARHFVGVRPRYGLVYAAGILTTVAVAFFDYTHPSLNARGAVMSFFMAVIFGATSIRLLKSSQPRHRFGVRLTGIMFAVSGALLLIRGVYFQLAPPLTDSSVLSGISGVLFVSVLASMGGLGIGFIILADERVISELENAKDDALRSKMEIDERKRAEVVLRESELRLIKAQHLAQLGGWERVIETDTIYWSDEMFAILGRPAPPSNFAAFLSCVHEEDREKILQADSRVAASVGPVELEYRIVRPNGEVRFMRSVVEAIRNNHGAAVRIVGATQDITDLKRAQQETLTRQKLESLGVLANGIAHDFNNILGGILASTELGLAEQAEGVRVDDELSRIRAASMRGAEIVRQLMIYSGSDDPAYEALDLSELVGELLELLKVSISKHAILVTELAAGLPLVRANASQIRQVVMNLVVNASEAIGERDGKIRVTTTRALLEAGTILSRYANVPVGEYVRLEVFDTGCGMTPEVRAKMFDPFFTTKGTGRGLGLATTQGIIHRHGGSVDVKSAAGQGSSVEILLPCAAEPAQTPIEAARPSALEPAVESRTVLVIEDEEILRVAVSKMLRKERFDVIEAGDGTTAASLFRANKRHIGVVLLDVTLPGMSSRDLLDEILRIRPDVKVILTSAFSRDQALSTIGERKPWGYIRKPYQFRELAGLLQKGWADRSG